jgi:hypothetical protein
MPWPFARNTVAETSTEVELSQIRETVEFLEESLAELAMDDRGWRSMSAGVADDFTDTGRREIVLLCRYMAVSNPLIKRALIVRIGYIWGQSVQVTGRAGEEDAQDVNAVVQQFWDDNTSTLTGSQAQEELERALGTDGEIYLSAFTSPLTGRIQTRSTPTVEIVDIICNPEDRDDQWFYVREYTRQVIEPGQGTSVSRTETVKEVHPALGFRPRQRIKTLNGAPVMWDAPILHIPVNRLDGWQHGVPDVYAAIAWARLYRDFLVNWAGLTESLSKIAWRMTGDTKSRAQRAATAATAMATTRPVGVGGEAGQAVVMGPGNTLEAIPKAGAHIDADSGKPLAGMVAAGVGLPITMLLADPGVTGARATAETLDVPTILEMTMRRMLWQGKLTQLLDYVIDQAVIAPKGPLKGTQVVDDWGRRVVTLTGDVERTVEWEWPPLVDIDPVEFIKAIVEADGTNKLPPLTTLKLLLTALGVKDVDEVIDSVTDEQGNWIDPGMSAGQAATDRFRAGQDPAAGMS